MVARKNIFQSIGHELGVFFGTNKDNKGQGTLQHIVGDVGHGVHEVLTLPQNIIKQAGSSVTDVLKQAGSSGSLVLDSAGGAVNKSVTGLGGLAQNLTLPLLVGGGVLVAFSFLNRR